MRLVLMALMVFAAPIVGAANSASHTIDMENMQFSPAQLTVKAGDSVTWVNKDLVPHAILGSGMDSKTIAPGEKWTYHFKKKGDFKYDCAFHPTMHGDVTVQ
jgi:plastocyanin